MDMSRIFVFLFLRIIAIHNLLKIAEKIDIFIK